MANHSAASFEIAPTVCTVVNLPYLTSRFAELSRMKHRMGSGLAFAFGDVAPVRTQPIFAPLQSDLRFFLLCCPHRRRNILRCICPLRGAIRIYPVPLERRDGLGPLFTPTVLVTHDGRSK